jgi:hypothetical protein
MMHVGNDTTEERNQAIKRTKKVHRIHRETVSEIFFILCPNFSKRNDREGLNFLRKCKRWLKKITYWAEHMHSWERSEKYEKLYSKSPKRRNVGRPQRTCEDNVKVDLKKSVQILFINKDK